MGIGWGHHAFRAPAGRTDLGYSLWASFSGDIVGGLGVFLGAEFLGIPEDSERAAAGESDANVVALIGAAAGLSLSNRMRPVARGPFEIERPAVPTGDLRIGYVRWWGTGIGSQGAPGLGLMFSISP